MYLFESHHHPRIGESETFPLNLKAIVVILLLFAAYRPAAAANIVLNGGFETGDFTGWTLTNTEGGNTGVDDSVPHTGTYEASLANTSA